MDELDKLYEETITKLRNHLNETDLLLAEKYTYGMLRRMRLFNSVKNAHPDTIIEQLEAGGIEFFALIAELSISMAEDLKITQRGIQELEEFDFNQNFSIDVIESDIIGFIPTTDVGETLLVMSEVIGHSFGMIDPQYMTFTHRYRPDWHRHFLYNQNQKE